MAIISVTRTKRGLAKPASETPLTTLDLSVIDRIPVLRCNARTLHAFKHGPEASRVIREALSKALVPYYPLAGRLKESEPGCLQIECLGEGAWFVEAFANCNLESVNYFEDVESIPYDDLLPDDVPEVEGVDPLVKIQVTQFGCGGFVIGLIFCHSICDGLGAAQFLNAVGELATGLNKPTIQPVWHRNFSPFSQTPHTPEFPNLPLMGAPQLPNYHLQHTNIDIPIDKINGLKTQFQRVTGRTCSAFEIVAAGCWRSRTRAVDLDPETEVKLVFFANCRRVLDPPLPVGFYGNCFFPVTITTSCESLREKEIVDVVKMIQEAKGKLNVEFEKYLKGEKEGEDPFAPPLKYSTLFISEWGRLGFNNVDYGWGPPIHVVPIQGSSVIPVGIVGSMPRPNKGIRLMTWCVEETHRVSLVRHMCDLMKHSII